MFKDQVVLIAGALRGIGAELAALLAGYGARLSLASRDAEALERVANQCRQLGATVLVCVTDLTDSSQCVRMVNDTVTFFGRLDVLLYNAGKGYPGWFESQSDTHTAQMEMDLNYWGLVHSVRAALPHLTTTKGRIVGVATLGALVGLPYFAGYNAAKHAMSGFLNTLRVELLPHQVSVTVVYPGAVSTEQLQTTLGDHIQKVPTLSPADCARQIIKGAWKRKRSVIPNFSGKMLRWIYPLLPAVLDRYLLKMTKIYQK